MRALVVVLALWLASPAIAHAAVPSASASTVDPILIGDSSGLPLGQGFTVQVRKISLNPVPGAQVQLIFQTTAASPLREQEAGSTTNCVTHTISRLAGGDGVAVFHAAIAGYDNATTVQVRADGILLRNVSVRSTDLTLDGRTDVADLQLFRQNFLHTPGAAETDYDGNGLTDVADLNLFRAEFLRNGHGTVCP